MVLVPPGGALVMAEKTLFQETPNSSKIRSRTFWRSLSGRLPVPSSWRCELRAILTAGEKEDHVKLAWPDVFRPRIVFAGCPALVEGDGDDAELVAALRKRGDRKSVV